jgi:hypothetical protein
MSTTKLYEDGIVAEHECCCYCGDVKRSYDCKSCGEGHFETYYEYEDGEWYRADEVSLIDGGSRPKTDEELFEAYIDNQVDLKLGK